jgi:hypothetical protein
MHRVFVSKNREYHLTRPIVGVSCDRRENRECMTLPAGATVQPTQPIRDSGVIHVRWGEELVTIFAQDFRRSTKPSE